MSMPTKYSIIPVLNTLTFVFDTAVVGRVKMTEFTVCNQNDFDIQYWIMIKPTDETDDDEYYVVFSATLPAHQSIPMIRQSKVIEQGFQLKIMADNDKVSFNIDTE